jgi:Ni/Co efflux regulator RcnB
MHKFITANTIFAFLALNLTVAQAADIGVSVAFSDAEVRIISAWYDDHRPTKDRKSGKAKGNGLPPGIAKNLARGKSLPPGIAMQNLPDGLRHSLPAPPDGYERIIVDGKILLVEVATKVIHDVLMDVMFD